MNKMRRDVDEREIVRETLSKILDREKGANYINFNTEKREKAKMLLKKIILN